MGGREGEHSIWSLILCLSQLFFICSNNSLGVEKGASPVVAFKCRYRDLSIFVYLTLRADGIYAVPENMTWPECFVKTTTAKPREANVE